MTRFTIIWVAAALALASSSPVLGDDDRGKVEEIIIKIQTKEGVKWYRLGKDLERIEIKEGDYVHFDYADDDTIEAIEVEPSKAPKTTQ